MQIPFEDQTIPLDLYHPEPERESAQGRRRARFAARAALWKCSTLSGLRACGRFPGQGKHAVGDWVGVKKGATTAGYSGLCTCGSVWACPRCSAMIAMTRSLEIGRAVSEVHSQGGAVYLMTLTMRHHAGHSLAELWKALGAGWEGVKGTEEWTGRKERVRKTRNDGIRIIPGVEGQRDRHGVAGLIRCTEATFGKPSEGGNGWHLHAHVLVFTTETLHWYDLWELASGMFMRWARGVEDAGLPRPTGEGFDFRVVADGGAEFIGKYLSKATLDVASRIGAEVGGGRNTKSTRKKVNVTPFELLHELTAGDRPVRFSWAPRRGEAVEVLSSGWIALAKNESKPVEVVNGKTTTAMERVERYVQIPGLWQRWIEWEQGSKGKWQITWSQRIKHPESARELLWNAALDARGREETDEEIAQRDLDGELIAQVEASVFYEKLSQSADLMCTLLEVVEQAADSEEARQAAVAWGVENGIAVEGYRE